MEDANSHKLFRLKFVNYKNFSLKTRFTLPEDIHFQSTLRISSEENTKVWVGPVDLTPRIQASLHQLYEQAPATPQRRPN